MLPDLFNETDNDSIFIDFYHEQETHIEEFPSDESNLVEDDQTNSYHSRASSQIDSLAYMRTEELAKVSRFNCNLFYWNLQTCAPHLVNASKKCQQK